MRSTSALVAALGLALALPTAGCAFEEPAESASVEVPLVQAGPDGSLFRLRASFEVTAPDGNSTTYEGPLNEPSLVLDLNPGIHTVTLLDGWVLERSFNNGASYQTAPAILASANPTGIRVVPNRQVEINFEFFVRETTGTMNIKFGVDTQPRQLSGGFRFVEGTGAFASITSATRVDVQIYFNDATQTLGTETDGSRTRVYDTVHSAVEIFNDTTGIIAPAFTGFAGGYLSFTTRAKPDGTTQFQAEYFANDGAVLKIEPSTDAQIPVGTDGAPADQFFYAGGSQVVLTTAAGDTLRGTLQSIRHFQ
jgi:hypothetical protein